jgi:acetyltransferase-like isoleucine patch superfamily enzyme
MFQLLIKYIFKLNLRISDYYDSVLKRLYLKRIRVLFGKRFSCSEKFIFGKDLIFHFDLSDSEIRLGKYLQVRDRFQIRSCEGAKVLIGDYNFFNNDCAIHAFGHVIIGNNNQFGEGVKIYDHNHQYKDKGSLISEQGYRIGKIKIGSNCWIGSNVIVLRNVEIGDHVIIGAGCIIHKSIPTGTIVYNSQHLNHRKC